MKCSNISNNLKYGFSPAIYGITNLKYGYSPAIYGPRLSWNIYGMECLILSNHKLITQQACQNIKR